MRNEARIALLEHAASLLDADASSLRQSHTIPPHSDWGDEIEARISHDDLTLTANCLRNLVLEMRTEAAHVGAVTVSAHELNRLLQADCVLTWLEENVTHLEHGPRSLEDGYWPHSDQDVDPFPNFFGITLREYALRRMSGERGQKTASKLALMHDGMRDAPDRAPRNWIGEQGPRHFSGLRG